MNKKIWIGLISIFLVLVLVLGFQMLNEKSTKELDLDTANESLGQNEEKIDVIVPEENEELPLIETEDIVEPVVQTQVPNELETPVETVEPPKTIETPTETSKPSEVTPTEDDGRLYVTLSVSVKTLLDKKDKMNSEKWELVPEDGWIFTSQKVELFEGESAFNVLLREMKKNKIHMEFVMTPLYNSNYIQGIGNLYEFDCGELSGWMYAVNDLSPNFGTSNYTLKDGDVVKILYTCDLGRDLGFEFNE